MRFAHKKIYADLQEHPASLVKDIAARLGMTTPAVAGYLRMMTARSGLGHVIKVGEVKTDRSGSLRSLWSVANPAEEVERKLCVTSVTRVIRFGPGRDKFRHRSARDCIGSSLSMGWVRPEGSPS